VRSARPEREVWWETLPVPDRALFPLSYSPNLVEGVLSEVRIAPVQGVGGTGPGECRLEPVLSGVQWPIAPLSSEGCE
jgi:hypothetical protein